MTVRDKPLKPAVTVCTVHNLKQDGFWHLPKKCDKKIIASFIYAQLKVYNMFSASYTWCNEPAGYEAQQQIQGLETEPKYTTCL